jgi:hypothetical protein
MAKIFFTLIFCSMLISPLFAQSDAGFVSNVEEFYEHTSLHRERVKKLGVELFKTHPELFAGLNLEQVTGVLEAHDLAKASSASIAPDGRPFYRTLYADGYGKKLDRTIVDALNLKDKEFMEQALKFYGLDKDPELLAKISRIEKIADFVDRGMSPVSVEEFGRAMDKASDFMNSEDDKILARELEQRYEKVIGRLGYKKLTPVQRQAVKEQLNLLEMVELKKRVKVPGFQVQCARTMLTCLTSGLKCNFE